MQILELMAIDEVVCKRKCNTLGYWRPPCEDDEEYVEEYASY